MKQTKYFDTDAAYEAYYSGSIIPSKEIAVIGDYEKVYTCTNNIDGETKSYETADEPTGSISITENGSNIDIAQYATANVNVPIPSGYIVPTGTKSITENGEDIDVTQYASVNVNVSGGSTPSITWLNSTTAGTWGEMVTPVTAITTEVTVGKTYRIHFDGTYSSETRYLYIWGHGSDYDVEGMYGYIDPSVNNFDFTILPFIYSSSEGGSTEMASDFELHIAIVDGAPETEQGVTYAFRYAELPQYPAGGPVQ